jgi:hypothetical protein
LLLISPCCGFVYVIFHAPATAKIKGPTLILPYPGVAERDIGVTIGILDQVLTDGYMLLLLPGYGFDGLFPCEKEETEKTIHQITNYDRYKQPENHDSFIPSGASCSIGTTVARSYPSRRLNKPRIEMPKTGWTI